MGAWDYILVGGGLQNGLIALAVLHERPAARVLLLEKAERIGGNHTWSFHTGSVPEEARAWADALIEHSWPRYRVRFPGKERVVDHPYATCSSEHFARLVEERFARAPNAELRTGAEVLDIGAREVRVRYADGRTEDLAAACVVDARGPREGFVGRAGFQKFVGLEVELATPLDPELAELMDATVTQDGAFRFVYVLPFGPTRALVEDTYFANGPELDVPTVRQRVLDYLAQRGLKITAIHREEHGVLPMPWKAVGPIPRVAPLVAGYRGGWFHPATGYSVPVALRLACHVASRAPEAVFGGDFDRLAERQEQQAKFAYLLNELLFHAAEPDQRWKVFRHFYELPDELVLRFYSLDLEAADKRRMFLRKPPPGVNFLKAMKILPAWGLR